MVYHLSIMVYPQGSFPVRRVGMIPNPSPQLFQTGTERTLPLCGRTCKRIVAGQLLGVTTYHFLAFEALKERNCINSQALAILQVLVFH